MGDRDPLVIEVGSAGEPLGGAGGGAESGDLHVVVPFLGGALVAVIDGLGHGPEAAEAARMAARVLEAHPGEPVPALVERCHEDLRHSRGVVMSLASFDASASILTAVGVGNVELVLLRARPGPASPRDALTLRGGIVGYQVPPSRAMTFPLSRDDTVIMATDGIRSGFWDGVELTRPPGEIAASILARHGRGSDDALVVVARYLGAPA